MAGPGMKGDQRPEPPLVAGERDTLTGFLRYQRATLEWKCSDLAEPDLLRAATVPSTNLTLLGLVRHMAEVERSWTRRRVEGDAHATPLWCTRERPDADFDDVATADVAEAFTRWREECAHTDAVLAARDLGDTFSTGPEWTLSLRWLLAHLIEEYARHNGHADLLREAIDGQTGE